MVDYHEHTGTDSPRLNAKRSILKAPQSTMTTASAGSLTTGGGAVLSSADAIILNNALTRIAEIQTKLTNLGLIR